MKQIAQFLAVSAPANRCTALTAVPCKLNAGCVLTERDLQLACTVT